MKNAYIAQVIKDECTKQGIPISLLLKECDIRKSLIYDLEKRDYTPSAHVLYKIAEYFDISLDYLTGRTNSPKIHKEE